MLSKLTIGMNISIGCWHYREILASNDVLIAIEALTNELQAESDSDSDDEASDDLFLLSELKKVISSVTYDTICFMQYLSATEVG